tara:strand:- start:5 stop:301 length:297 start_codon:yes stop_codon:yes gene_type:complete
MIVNVNEGVKKGGGEKKRARFLIQKITRATLFKSMEKEFILIIITQIGSEAHRTCTATSTSDHIFQNIGLGINGKEKRRQHIVSTTLLKWKRFIVQKK